MNLGNTPADRRLACFLAASLLLHGGVLAALSTQRSSASNDRHAVPFLSASLEMPRQTATLQQQPRPEQVSRDSNSPEPAGEHIASGPAPGGNRQATASEDSSATAMGETASETPAAQASRPRTETTGQRLNQALQPLLLPYFHYPLQARRQGWQGEVHVAVHVAQDGRLSRLRVALTSGYPALDAAALDSLGKVRQLPETAVRALDRSGYDLHVPVVYRLTGS